MSNMKQTLISAFRTKDLRDRLIFTVLMLVVFRIGANIPVPGIDRLAFTELIQRFGTLGSMMDLMSGGALLSVSVFAMGVQPYINASIIMQLLTVAIPALEEMSKEGETGRKKIDRITRLLALVLATVQSVAFYLATRSAQVTGMSTFVNALVVILTFVAGTSVVMWIAELINEKGMGNGVSLLIFAGIVSRLPSMVVTLFQYIRTWSGVYHPVVGILFGLLIVGLFAAGFLLVIYVNTAERRIPVQYARRVVGRKQYGGQATYLPIKVNKSSVMPVIFSMAIAQVPSLIVSIFFINSNGPVVNWFRNLGQNPLMYIFYVILILAFTFFYSSMQYNPVEIANNLQKNGGFVPGIRPGRPTSDYIHRISNRLNWVDGAFLSIITVTPMIIGAITNTQALWLGGTSLVILVGVCLDIMNQLESQLSMRHYKGFLD